MLTMTGCCVSTSFILNNNTLGDIVVISCHTKISKIIKKNSCGEIYHTDGCIKIITSNKIEWYYNNISIPDIKDKQFRKNIYRIYCNKLLIYLNIDKNGEICMLPIKNIKIGCPLKQPSGYPLKPNQ